MAKKKTSLTYKAAGVDIDAGDRFTAELKKLNPNIGGFSGLFPVNTKKFKQPCLVSSTDGVGTKLLIADMMQKFDTIGIDLVGMVVNDIIVCGAQPLFFLDYYATPKLDVKKATQIMKGIVKGLNDADCMLLGGETAELPGLYTGEKFDLAGFAVGIIDKDKVINGKKIKPGDAVIGIESSGLHSNGYSLARKIFFGANKCDPNKPLKGMRQKLGLALLKPTIIYIKPILNLMKIVQIKGVANITGGGLAGNLVRVLPKNVTARIDIDSWKIPVLFTRMQELGNVALPEMFKTFNMGIGLTVVVDKKDVKKTISTLKANKLKAFAIGEIEKGNKEVLLEKDGKAI